MSKLDFDPKKTAMLVMDCQKGIVGFVPSSVSIFKKVPGVLETARKAGIHVIHTADQFTKECP
jgi:nicotinamidase-related amidase